MLVEYKVESNYKYESGEGGEWVEVTPSTKKRYTTLGGAKGQITYRKQWCERVKLEDPLFSFDFRITKLTYDLIKEESIPV